MFSGFQGAPGRDGGAGMPGTPGLKVCLLWQTVTLHILLDVTMRVNSGQKSSTFWIHFTALLCLHRGWNVLEIVKLKYDDILFEFQSSNMCTIILTAFFFSAPPPPLFPFLSMSAGRRRGQWSSWCWWKGRASCKPLKETLFTVPGHHLTLFLSLLSHNISLIGNWRIIFSEVWKYHCISSAKQIGPSVQWNLPCTSLPRGSQLWTTWSKLMNSSNE